MIKGFVKWQVKDGNKVVSEGNITNRIYPALGRDLFSVLAGGANILDLENNDGGIAVDLDGSAAELASGFTFQAITDDPANWIMRGNASWQNSSGIQVAISQYLIGRNWNVANKDFDDLYGATRETGVIVGDGQTLDITYEMKWGK